MIRGINKRVIEINDIGSEYFEKALLIVRDNKATVPNLEREADRVMQTYFPKVTPTKQVGLLRRRANLKRKLFFFGCVASAVLTVGIIVLLII